MKQLNSLTYAILAQLAIALVSVSAHAQTGTPSPLAPVDPLKERIGVRVDRCISAFEAINSNPASTQAQKQQALIDKNACVGSAHSDYGGSDAGSCSATIAEDLKQVTTKRDEALKACNSAAVLGQSETLHREAVEPVGDSDEVPAIDTEFDSCIAKIQKCNELQDIVEQTIAEEEEEENTGSIIDTYLPLYAQSQGLSLPYIPKKKKELGEDEVAYLKMCPKRSKEELKDEQDRLEKKKKDLAERIEKKNEAIEEVTKKAIEENKKAQEEQAKLTEKMRDSETKTAERLADHYKDIAAAKKEIAQQRGDLIAAGKAKRREQLAAREKYKRANKQLLPNAIQQLKHTCNAKYTAELAKLKGIGMSKGPGGAFNAYAFKLNFVSECVRQVVDPAKAERDAAEMDIKDANSEARDIVRASSSLSAQATQLEESAKQQEAAIRQGKDLEVSAHQEMILKQQQDLQRTLQAKQQELARLSTETQKAKEEIELAELDNRRLGKAPKGKETIEDAKSAVGTLKSLVLDLEKAKVSDSTQRSCKDEIDRKIGKLAPALKDIDITGTPIRSMKKNNAGAKGKPGTT